MVSDGKHSEREIFLSVLSLGSAGEREAHLKKVCAGRPKLLNRVRSLLEANEIEDGLLDTPTLASGMSADGSGVTEGPGAIIGRYKLLERIGEGGMAIVYMAEQESPVRRKVALKIIRLGMDTKGVIARFEAERQALAMMEHPGIAKVFDGGATETGRPYFVMELVQGVPITEYCDAHKLNTARRLRLFIQACQAIQHAHQKGIIHRDIKPSNILVEVHDGAAVPKVIDFGVAKATEQRLTDATLFTQFQALIGTPAYMSPEQAQMGGIDVDTRADIYALGVLLYELLTGRTPFEAKDLLRTGLDEYRRTIREKEPARPSTRVATLGRTELLEIAARRQTESARLVRLLATDLDWIVLKCLEKDRTRRYETASGLAMDIQRYLDGEPVLARPPSRLYRLRKFVRRNKAIAAVAAIVVLAAMVSTRQAVRATRAEREQSRLRTVAQSALYQEAHQRQRAEAEQMAALRRAYNSDMNLVQQALAAHNYGRVVGLLNRYQPTDAQPDFRQWEWRYFWNQSRSEAAFAFPRQPEAVREVTISPNGRVLATSTMGGVVKLWDLTGRSEVVRLEEPGLNGRALVFSGDGTLIAIPVERGRRRSSVQIWTVAGRTVKAEFPFDGRIQALAFSSDDTKLLILGDDMAVHAWDFDGRQLESRPAPRAPRGWALARPVFSPHRDAVAFVDGARIRVTDTLTGADRTEAEAFEGGTASLAISPDGKMLAAGPSFTEMATYIKLISTESGEEIGRLTGHVSWVPGLAFTPDGTQLVSSGADQTVRIWDLPTETEAAALHGHLSEVYCVAVSPDGHTLVSGCKDGTLFGWDKRQIEHRHRLETLPVPVTALEFLPDGRGILSVQADGTVSLWETETLREVESIAALGQDVDRLLISSDGSHVIAGTRRGELRILDWATRLVIASLKEPRGRDGRMTPVGLIDEDRTLVAMKGGSTVCLVDLASLQTIQEQTIEGAGSWFRSAPVLSPDGRLLVTPEFDGQMAFLDLATGQTQIVKARQPWGVSDMAFSPDGDLLVTSSAEGTINLWNLKQREVVDVLRGHLIGVEAVAFSPDGQRLASGSQGDEAVKLWDVATWHEVGTLTGEGLMKGGLRFSPDGRLLAAINAQGQAHLWRAPPLDEIGKAPTAADGFSSSSQRAVLVEP